MTYPKILSRLFRRLVLSLTAAFVVLSVLGSLALAQKTIRPTAAHRMVGFQAATDTTDPFFQAVPYATAGSAASFVAAADLNGDGKPDLVLVENPQQAGVDGSVAILLGNGDGTFQAATLFDIGVPGGNTVTVGDLNHDGKLDLIVASAGWVSVLLGNGDGSVKPAVVYTTGGGLYEGGSVPPILVDLKGDGKLDVIVVNQTTGNNHEGSAAVFLGNGDGSLQPVKDYDSGGFFVSSIAVADLNHDGIKDIVVLNCAASGAEDCSSGGGTAGVLMGKGDGTFGAVQSYVRGELGSYTSPVTVADYNGDGVPDILIGNTCLSKQGECGADATVGLFAGYGDGTFHPAVNYDSGGPDVGSIAVTDVYGDGKLDLLLGNWGEVGVLRGNGDGTFRYPDSYVNVSDFGVGVQVADVNGDGIPDIISSGHGSVLYVSLLLGNGNGFTASIVFESGSSPVVVSDLNHDGRPDLIAPGFCNSAYCEGDADMIGVLLNNPGFVYDSTVTKVTSNIETLAPNQSVTYTVTVSNPRGTAVSGDVECYAHPKNYLTPFFQGSLVNNQVVFSIHYPSPSTQRVQCQYSGDSANLGSVSQNLSEYVRVLPVDSKTTLTTSGSPSQAGQPVTFTAHVISNLGDIPDGEKVTFYDGATVLGSASLSSAIATFTTSSLSVKKHSIKAVYPGDATFKTSHGTVVEIVVN
jgi:hypothetical protein